LTNKAVREFGKKVFANAPAVAKELNLNVLSYLHLDPNHKAFMLMEVPSAEAARDYLVRAGFMHFTEMEFHLVTPIEELMQRVDEIPTLYTS
jgi:hypothetical protein